MSGLTAFCQSLIIVSLQLTALFLSSCSCLWFIEKASPIHKKTLSTVDLDMFSFFLHSKGWVRKGIQNHWITLLHQCFSLSTWLKYTVLFCYNLAVSEQASFKNVRDVFDSSIKPNKFHKYFLHLKHCFSTLVLLEAPKKKCGNYRSAISLLHIEFPGESNV